MPFQHVQTQTNANTTGDATLSLTVAAGNSALVNLILDGTTAPVQTVGPTLTQRALLTTSANIYQYNTDAALAAGSTTFTFSYTGTGAWRVYVTEVEQLQNGAAGFDVAALGTNATSTTFSTGTTATTAQADEFLMAAWNFDASLVSSGTVDNSFTIPTNGDKINFANTMPSAVAYRIVAATGTYTTTLTLNDTGSGNGLLGTYKAAAVATGDEAQQGRRMDALP